MSREDYDNLTAQGIDVETVGDLLGGRAVVEPVLPPILPGQATFPTPGLYFDMPEEDYHAIHAASTSGLKRLSVSSMDYWANSLLYVADEDEEVEREKRHLIVGKAYHARILEGREAYEAAFAVDLREKDYEGLLKTTEQIKYAIAQLGSKPCAKGYDDISRAAKKEDWVAQLLDLDPNALVWDAMVSAHRAKHEGKTFISASLDRRVQIAAAMIESHPELGRIFTGGYAEVSAFWFCPETGAPMKARFDYLKMALIVDLKSFGNNAGMPINRAIEKTIANYRYNLQHVIYEEAAQAVKALIRQDGHAIFGADDAQRAWALTWAQRSDAPRFMFVFQQTGTAPVTRGRIMPTEVVYSVTQRAAETLKLRWVSCAQTYGTDPWLDIEPIDTIEDEAIPLWATEF